MKRHQVILIVCGILTALVCLGVGWFLFSALSAKNEAAEARNQAYSELRKIYGQKVFPSKENIERVKEDEKALTAWLTTASNVVHKGDLVIGQESPTGFKKLLLDTVRSLANHPGGVSGKVVASGFNFGFDRYLGESTILPEKDQVDRLARQLSVIETICNELYAAKIVSLDAIARETFEEKGASEKKVQEDRPSNRPKNKNRRSREDVSGRGAKASAAQGGAVHDSDLFSKQRFTFQFRARPDALVEVLNRLAAMDLFIVVAETEIRKTEDPLVKPASAPGSGPAKKSGAPFGAAVVDPATVPHAQRIVTDPELDAPVSVKLDIDVYSFEGV